MSKTIKFLVCLHAILILSGCYKMNDLILDSKEEGFYKLVGLTESDDINTSMKMAISEYTQLPYTNGENLYLDVNLDSSATPLHTQEERFEFYIYDADQNQWLEVNDLVTRDMPEDFAIYPMENIDPIPLLFAGIPELDQEKKGVVTIRAFFCVEIVENGEGTGRKMAAFLDIEVASNLPTPSFGSNIRMGINELNMARPRSPL